MDIRPTTIETACRLAESGERPTVGDIKIRLRAEGFAGDQLVGPRLLADLRRRCRKAAGPPEARQVQGPAMKWRDDQGKWGQPPRRPPDSSQAGPRLSSRGQADHLFISGA